MTIRDYRKINNLTIRQLSSLTGVSYQQIQAAETGKADPSNMSARNLLALAKALKADPHELIEPYE